MNLKQIFEEAASTSRIEQELLKLRKQAFNVYRQCSDYLVGVYVLVDNTGGDPVGYYDFYSAIVLETAIFHAYDMVPITRESGMIFQKIRKGRPSFCFGGHKVSRGYRGHILAAKDVTYISKVIDLDKMSKVTNISQIPDCFKVKEPKQVFALVEKKGYSTFKGACKKVILYSYSIFAKCLQYVNSKSRTRLLVVHDTEFVPKWREVINDLVSEAATREA